MRAYDSCYAMLPLLLCSILFVVVLVWALFGYRRHHKLPPGPKPWPVVGNFPHMGPAPHRSLAELARVYGPLMHLRLGSVDIVVAASAGVAEQFLKTHDANFSSRPPNAGAKYVAYNYKDMVFGPYGPRWRLMRKITAVHLFSAKALEHYRHVRQEEVAVLVKAVLMSSGTSSVVKVGQVVNDCAANSLGRVMLGRRVFGDGSKSSDLKSQEFKSMVVEIMVLSGMLNLGDFLPSLQWLDLQRIQSRMVKIHRKFDTFLSTILEDRYSQQNKAAAGNDDDMLSALLFPAATEDNNLTDIEIKALLLNMFVAGTDTSSSTVEWGIAELIKHPKTMAQVQEELDSVVGKDRLVTEMDLPRLTFFQAVIKEVFRLHPSTPLSLPRIASQACEVNGYQIPKGATLLVDIWAINRDPNEWVRPLEFCPERFLPGAQKAGVDLKGNDFEFIPFGAGRRICAGLSLALRTVQFITATLVHTFDWELPHELSPMDLNMEEGYGLTLQRAQPLMLKPKPRLSHHVYGTLKGHVASYPVGILPTQKL